MSTKKREKAEDFIGRTFNDGKLKVIGITGKYRNTTLFKVTCETCLQDPELFPDGYFVSLKGSLVKGALPCGCGYGVKWSRYQYLIRIKRQCEKLNCSVQLDLLPETIDSFTKISITCNRHDTANSITLHRFLNSDDYGCKFCAKMNRIEMRERVIFNSGKIKKLLMKLPIGSDIVRISTGDCKANYLFKCGICSEDEYTKNGVCSGWFKTNLNRLNRGEMPCRCSKSPRYTEDQRIYSVIKLLSEYNGSSLISVDPYKGKGTYFTWLCGACKKQHKTTYHNFINKGSRCQIFDMERINYVYVSDWVSESDHFIKIGISHNLNKRVDTQSKFTKYNMVNIQSFKFNNYRLAKGIESFLLRSFPHNYVESHKFEDGFTETMNPKYRNFIIKFLERISVMAAQFTKNQDNFIEVAEQLFDELCLAEEELKNPVVKDVKESKKEEKIEEVQQPTEMTSNEFVDWDEDLIPF